MRPAILSIIKLRCCDPSICLVCKNTINAYGFCEECYYYSKADSCWFCENIIPYYLLADPRYSGFCIPCKVRHTQGEVPNPTRG